MQHSYSYPRIRGILAVVLALGMGAGAAFAQDSYWTNATSTFSDAGAWSNGVPGLSTNVWFDNGQTFTVTMDGDYVTRGVIVTNGTVVTIDLNDGTARTWEAAGTGATPDTRDPKIEVRGSTLIVTDSGTLDANNTPVYQTQVGLTLSGGSTAIISNGAYVDVGYIGGIVMGATDTLIVTDPGSVLWSDGMSPTTGSSILVSNGATFRGVSWYGGGDLIVTGPGSKGQFGAYVYGTTSLKITDGGRIDSTAEFTGDNVTIGGGSGVSTGQVSTSYVGDGYNPYNWKVTTNGVLDIIGGYLEVRDGYYPATSSILTMDQGTIAMQTNSQLRLKENAYYDNDDGDGGILRGTGTIQRRTASGDNFKILNEGLIQPGDTTATPAIGTLTVMNGDLFQTNATLTVGAGLRFDFDPSVAESADLIDITGGSATITLGSNVFNNISGATSIGFGTWDFLKADTIIYTPAYDNLSNLVAGLSLPPATLFKDWTYGVVDLGSYDVLRLSVNMIPEPSTILLLVGGGLLVWRFRRQRR
ncbi:PEP-CTERM sorting domain-containing protein [bacterium]|nr:PEP-CTERM sorting domain-containing protein [bacterium]